MTDPTMSSEGPAGTAVTMYAGTAVQRRMVRTGSSYLSQSEIQPLLFGLGERDEADSVVIEWPTSGRRDVVGPLEVRVRYFVAESNGLLRRAR